MIPDVLRVAWNQAWSSLFAGGDFWLGVIAGYVLAFTLVGARNLVLHARGWRLRNDR